MSIREKVVKKWLYKYHFSYINLKLWFCFLYSKFSSDNKLQVSWSYLITMLKCSLTHRLFISISDNIHDHLRLTHGVYLQLLPRNLYCRCRTKHLNVFFFKICESFVFFPNSFSLSTCVLAEYAFFFYIILLWINFL